MSPAAILREIREEWTEIVHRSGCTLSALSHPPTLGARLLSVSAKLLKGDPRELGWLPAIVYLAPADSSGRETCPNRTAGCAAVCLAEHSGRMVMRASQRARLWRTALRFGDPARFRAMLNAEVTHLIAQAAARGLVAAVRPDGGSDLGEGTRLAEAFPQIQVWDYTKSASRARAYSRGTYAPNYHLTLSYAGADVPQGTATPEDCRAFLRAGGNVAAVFSGKVPTSFLGAKTVDGDASDLRFLDPPGTVAALKFKGPRGLLTLAQGFAVS